MTTAPLATLVPPTPLPTIIMEECVMALLLGMEDDVALMAEVTDDKFNEEDDDGDGADMLGVLTLEDIIPTLDLTLNAY